MSDIITVKINGGLIIARKSSDSDYPGIDVEFVSDKENPKNLSRPRVLFEKPKDQELRALVWDDCKMRTTQVKLFLINKGGLHLI